MNTSDATAAALFADSVGTTTNYLTYTAALNLAGASRQLFNEALAFYIKAIYKHHALTSDDKHTLLIATHGLAALDNFPLARALVRLAFAHLTADEYLDYLDAARRATRAARCAVPF